jgi:hypothetical protein
MLASGRSVECGPCRLPRRSVDFEGTVPGAAVLPVEAVAARSGVREGGIDQGGAGAAEREFAGIEIGQTRLLRLQLAVGGSLQVGKLVERLGIGRERQQHGLDAAGHDQANGVAPGQRDRGRQGHLQAAAQRIDMAADLRLSVDRGRLARRTINPPGRRRAADDSGCRQRSAFRAAPGSRYAGSRHGGGGTSGPASNQRWSALHPMATLVCKT